MIEPKKILVTGANGFIGRALAWTLAETGIDVRGTVRDISKIPQDLGIPDLTEVGPCEADTDWHASLEGVRAIVHLAARAHVMNEKAVDPLTVFREVNTQGAVNLARQATESGVKRLVFVSTVKVNGETTGRETPFTPQDIPKPPDPYGLSKWEAEQALWEISADTGLEVVVVRPPLVYGAGVKGNMLRLLQWVDRGWPFPLGSVDNRRSLIGLDNLVDFLKVCIDHPQASGETFLVGDARDLSTPAMMDLIARNLGKKPRLPKVPVPVLRILTKATGMTNLWDRLCASLVVDSAHARRMLDWKPAVSVETGFKDMADWFRSIRMKG